MGSVDQMAFFDADETVISAKSMFDFLQFWMARAGDDGTGYAQVHDQMRRDAAAGVPRTEINRAYYRRYAGVALTDLQEAGREWYAAYRRRPTAFVTAVVTAMRGHQKAGHRTALVSGSFRACLDPVAQELGVDFVLCTEPLVDGDGRLTGEVRRPMIGAEKAEAVRDTITALGLDPAGCHAYGDHSSDLDMLRQVGRPTVVGEDPVLLAEASAHGWPVLSAATGNAIVAPTAGVSGGGR